MYRFIKKILHEINEKKKKKIKDPKTGAQRRIYLREATLYDNFGCCREMKSQEPRH